MNVQLFLAALAAVTVLPVSAQNYNYNYGGSRVVNQNQTGLAHPSASYIGPGTMSQSAQGLPPGTSGGISNPLLPRVNMGANIRTPGDNLYQQKPATMQTNPALPQSRMGANIGTPGDGMRSDIHYYVPGQNLQQTNQQNPNRPMGYMYKPSSGGGVATYAESNFSGGGVATYAESNFSGGSGDSGARRF